jgi:phosphoribosylanthranilate isomerase
MQNLLIEKEIFVLMYIIQAEKKEAEKLIKVARKNNDLKLIKAVFVTDNEKLVAALKRHYNIIVLKQDLLI